MVLNQQQIITEVVMIDQIEEMNLVEKIQVVEVITGMLIHHMIQIKVVSTFK